MLTATGTAAFVDVTDGMPDLIGVVLPATQPSTSCPAPGIQPAALPILSGDLAVTDAQPFPTSKDECLRGGWRSFAVFKNQGDCVSFVATKRKNQPANTPG
jgi:hypothetical protein